MKKFFIFITIILAVQLNAQTATTDQPLAVHVAVQNMFEALSNRDSVALKKYCAPDMQLIEYGQIWNLDTLINKAIVQNTSANFKRINQFEFISTYINHNTAWATYRLSSAFTMDTIHRSVKWIETVILVEEKGKWILKNLHSTIIK